jgi:hypothetical protein
VIINYQVIFREREEWFSLVLRTKSCVTIKAKLDFLIHKRIDGPIEKYGRSGPLT